MSSLCFWNDFELKKPPLVTIQVENTGFAKHVFAVINAYLKHLNDPDAVEFNETAALIGRLMARRKSSFRSMPGFRAVRKLNAALCRLLRLDLPRDLTHFRGALPDVCDNEVSGEMPTRGGFEYILVRLLSFYHLQERIRECCLAVARYFGQMLRNNFFMDYLTVLIAAVAKINKISKTHSNKCANLYNALYPQRSKFPQTDNKLLADKWVLPTKLAIVQLTDPKADEVQANPASVTLNIQAPALVTKVEKAKKKAKADVGTVIVRKEPLTETQTPFDLNSLTTVEDVKQFILRESKAREKGPESCLTKAIKNHEWLSARTLFERKLKAKEGAKAINIFRKFIGNKI